MSVYQQSTNQGCEVTIYRQQGQPGGVTLLNGKTADGKTPALISMHCTDAMGGGGAFGFVCKPEAGDTFFDTVVDDDWVDIVLTKNGIKWHVMRGMIDEVRRTAQSAGTGATTVVYTISGRSWQKVLTDTSVYLNIGQGENLLGTLANEVSDQVYGSLQTVQRRILLNVLKFMAQVKRGAWAMPLGMFNTQGQFYNTVKVDTTGVSKALPRVIAIQPFTIDNGNVWSLAQQYSDPNYTEIFCAQADFGKGVAQRYDLNGTQGMAIADTAMTIVIRDRPFIAVDSRLGSATGKNSPWFSLAKIKIDRQQIVAEDLGRSGQERKNSFNAFEGFDQVLMDSNPIAGFSPIWAASDMFTHGLRRMEVTSPYSYDQDSGVGEALFTLRRKLILKDWYALNPMYLNGSLQLGTGAPHVHVGTRLYVPGRTKEQDFNCYVEGVSHTWQMPQGTRSSFNVTRGYKGTDEAHLSVLQQACSTQNYKAARFGF